MIYPAGRVSASFMAATVASSVPLSTQFDDLVSYTNVLLPGIEGSKYFT